MVDIHSHILPEVDDGARSWEMATHMCHVAARDGITHIVATPHANDEFNYDRAVLEETLQELERRIEGVIKLGLGCDFHFSYDNLVALEENPSRFTISSTDYLLVELSDFSIPPWVTNKLDELLRTGITPIITHPERNPILQNHPQLAADWADMGCVVQITANSLTGRWGARASKAAQWLLKRGAVHVIATDCHNLESRPPVLSEAAKFLSKNYGEDVAVALCRDNPLAIVENRELGFSPE